MTTTMMNLINLAATLLRVTDGRKIKAVIALREATRYLSAEPIDLMIAKNAIDGAAILFTNPSTGVFNDRVVWHPLALHLETLAAMSHLSRGSMSEVVASLWRGATDDQINDAITLIAILANPSRNPRR